MKRKFLEDLGLTKEQVDAVMAENGSDIEAAKGDLAAVTAERDKLKKDVSDRDKQLDGLKKTAGDNEALTKQIADLQAENKAAKEKFEADMKDLRLSNAIKLAIGESAHDADLVAGPYFRQQSLMKHLRKVDTHRDGFFF